MSEQPSTQIPNEPGFRLLRTLILCLAGILLLVLLLLGSLSALLSTERGSQWLLGTATGFIPEQTLQLQFADSQGTFLRGLSLYDVQITMGENRITINELRGRWNPFTLLSGEFILDSLIVQGLEVNWQGGDPDDTADTTATDLSSTLDGIFPLPVTIRLTEFAVTDVIIRFNDIELDISTLRFAAVLRGRDLHLDTVHFDGLDALVDGDIVVELGGNYAISAAVNWQYSDLAGGAAAISGDLNQLTLQHQLQEPLLLDSDGSLTLGVADLLNARSDGGDLPLSINLTHSLPEPRLPFEGLEDITFSSTQINTRGWLDELQIDGTTGIETDRLPGPALQAELQWRAVYSDTTVTIEEFIATTVSGRLQTSGLVALQDVTRISLSLELDENDPASYLDAIPEMLSISGIHVLADLELEIAESGPRGTVTVQQMEALLDGYPLAGDGTLRYDGTELVIDDLNLQSDDSALHISGSYGETLIARLNINAPSLHNFYPPLSGSLMADIDVSGTLETLQIDIDARARELQYDNIHIDEIDIQGETRSNNNQVVNAQIRRVLVNDQEIDSVALRFDGQPENHSLTLDVTSSIAGLSLTANGGFVEGAWTGQLQNSELESDYGLWQQTQSSELRLSADLVQLAESCWLQGDASICLDASLDNGDALQATIALQSYPLAVLNDEQAASIVSAFDGDTGEYPQLPTNVQLPFTLHPDVAILGTANFQADITGALSALQDLAMQFSVELQNLEAYLRADPPPLDLADNGNGNGIDDWVIEQFLWEEASFNGALETGNWDISGRMAFFQRDVSGSGMAMRGTTTATLLMDPEYNLDGLLELDFDDLAWIEALVPQVHNATGRLDGTVNVNGSIESPGIGANINLREGALDVPTLGLELRGIDIALSSSDTETFRLVGRAESGSGQVELNADILQPMSDLRRMNLTLRGENFNVANMAEITVDISPDLRLEASESGINMTGSLTIPLLDARITQLPETAIDVSSDAVLVSQRDEAAPVRNTALADRGPLSDIPITGNVRVILGDDVRFSGFGLTAQVVGMLDINQRAGAAPLAYGELEVVEGNFQTYGRTLTIEQGKLLFFGPFDNPAIDIRAVRQVEHMRVGVQMNGTIRNIRSQLFSTPALPDGDIIAVMITGRPLAEIGQSQQDSNALVGAITTLGISQSAGLTDAVRGQLGLDTLAIDSTGDVHDSSLTLGKYITPRIFVRYAVGLFETANSLAIDYTVTDNIKLEAKSGQAQSLDITYTLER